MQGGRSPVPDRSPAVPGRARPGHAAKRRDEAQLAGARLDLERYGKLIGSGFQSRQSFDQQTGHRRCAEGRPIAVDEAAVDTAKLNLGYTDIRAPIDGRTGQRLVDLGNLIQASQSPPPSSPSRRSSRSSSTSPCRRTSPTRCGATRRRRPLDGAGLRQRRQDPAVEGKLTLIDNQIDTATGTLRLKATFDNADERLWPGQFVNVRLVIATRNGAVTVPQRAVMQGATGYYAYIVKPDNTVERRAVEVAGMQDGIAIVDKGLAAGEKIVVDGQYRLTDGAQIKIDTTRPPRRRRRPPRRRRPQPNSPPPNKSADRQAMNISETFIRRPIATSLMMLGLLVFGVGDLQPAAGRGAAQRRFSDHHRVGHPARRQPGDDGLVGRHAARAAVRRDPRPRLDELDQRARHDLDHPAVRPRTATSTAPRSDVQTAINAASGLLPKDLPNPPTYRKVNPADRAVLIYAVHSDDLPIYKVDDYAYTILAQKISTVTGVSQVLVAGQQDFAVRVQVNPAALAVARHRARGRAHRARQRHRQPGQGQPRERRTSRSPSTPTTSSSTPRAYRNVIVAYRNGAPVKLQDVADVVDAAQNAAHRRLVQRQARPSCCDLQRQPGANTVEVVDTHQGDDAAPARTRSRRRSMSI